MTSDEKLVLVREQVFEAERLIRLALATLPHSRDTRAMTSLSKAANSLRELDVLMRPATEISIAAGRTVTSERFAPR